MLLRREKTYYCRVWVPLDLRERLGRKELKRSLLTSNKQAAKLAEAELLHKTELAFSRLRINMLTERELEQITVLILADFSGKMENHRRERKDAFSFLESGNVPFGLGLNHGMKGFDLLDASFEFPRKPADAVAYYEDKISEIVTLKNSGAYRGDFRSKTLWLIQERGLDVELPPKGWFNENEPEWFSQPPAEFARVHDAILEGLIDGYNLELHRVQGVKNPAMEAAVLARIEAAKYRPRLSELWVAYKAYKQARGKWGAKSAKGYERFYTEAVAILGDKELAEYRQEDATNLLEALKSAGAGASTVTGKVEFLSSLFKYALKTPDSQEQWNVRSNPFTEMQVAGAGNDTKQVIPYTKEDLFALVTGLLKVRKLVEPHRFWVPLLALYSGMRQDEVCQLRTEDVKDVDGVLVFHICHKPELKQKNKGKKLKVCPVHPMLLRLGFGRFLEQQKAAGHARLFHTLSWSEGKDWTGRIRTWWNSTYQVLHVADATGKSFHSLRHNFLDWFKQNGCYSKYSDRSVIQSMVGHVAGDVTGEHYEEDYPPAEKLRMLAKLDYGFDRELIAELKRKEY